MSVSTASLNGARILQKPIADVILKSLEAAQWNGRGFKNLHQDVFTARGKAHGSAIHQALKSLRDAELIVMHGQAGSRRTTYYLPRYAPDARTDTLTAKRGPASTPKKQPGARMAAKPRELHLSPAMQELARELATPAPYDPSEPLTISVAEFLKPENGTVSTSPATWAPADTISFKTGATVADTIPAAVAALADRIAETVRAAVLDSFGATLAQAHADAAAAQELAEDAERRYNELRARLEGLLSSPVL